MKRIRISLRLMLLLVALLAVFFAWYGVRRDAERAELRHQMEEIQLYRDYTIKSGPQNHTNEAAWRRHLSELNSEIEKRQRELGDANQ